MAPAVRELAIKAYKAVSAWDDALHAHNLPDEVWEIAKDASGAGATFDVLHQLTDDLNIARQEKPDGDFPEWYERARFETGKTLLD